MKPLRLSVAVMFWITLLTGCTGMPPGVTPVSGFDVNRYLGEWYEIARLDHSFERGLEKITAQYTLKPGGGLRVINRGYDVESGQWREAEGRAYFIDDPQTGRLKVSFFGPFYGSYNIIRLDQEDYRYALVCGPDTSYLWILARDPGLDSSIVDELVAYAAEHGFDTSQLIYVRH
jgi:apolipoprotein D and lipocalin family protein